MRAEEVAVSRADVVSADHAHERGVAAEVRDALRDVRRATPGAVRRFHRVAIGKVFAEGLGGLVERSRPRDPLLAARAQEGPDVVVGVDRDASAGLGDTARVEDPRGEARVVEAHQDVADRIPEPDEEDGARRVGGGRRDLWVGHGDGSVGGLVRARGEGAAGGTAT